MLVSGMVAVNIYEAKTQFSQLVKRARAGEEIIIADDGKPVAKLVPIGAPPEPRVLGGDRGKIWLAADAFAPLTEAELADWSEGAIFPAITSPKPKKRPKRKPRSGRPDKAKSSRLR